jgi:hypothetical protein
MTKEEIKERIRAEYSKYKMSEIDWTEIAAQKIWAVVYIEEKMLQEINEILAHIEDTEKGEIGNRITILRGEINKKLTK